MSITLASKTLNIEDISDTPEYFEDTNFTAADSPATLDFNTALAGKNSTFGYIINDGPGDFYVSFSSDGIMFGDNIRLKKNEVLKWDNISVDSLRITWISDSAYRAAGV
jgi:hypothetical protein